MNTIVRLRNKFIERMTHNFAVPLLMKIRKNEKFRYTMDDLQNFPEGTIGKDLVEYLHKHDLHIMKNYERHDCKHIIFGYEMDQFGEGAMQFYFLGNGYYSLPVLSTVMAYLLLMPEEWKSFYNEFQKGRKGKKVQSLDQYKHNELVVMKTKDLKCLYVN